MSRVKLCKRGEERSEINISPLIDMVFILLIFFIVTTVFVEESGLELRTPEVTPPTTEQEKPLVFEIAKEMQVRVDGEDIRLDRIPSLIRASERGVEQSVSIKVAKSVPAHFTVSVIDRCQLEGIGNVTIGELVE